MQGLIRACWAFVPGAGAACGAPCLYNIEMKNVLTEPQAGENPEVLQSCPPRAHLSATKPVLLRTLSLDRYCSNEAAGIVKRHHYGPSLLSRSFEHRGLCQPIPSKADSPQTHRVGRAVAPGNPGHPRLHMQQSWPHAAKDPPL